jgi:hypothetical protein
MMEADTACETLEYIYILTQLVAWEDFIAFSRHESFKSCRNLFWRSFWVSFLCGLIIQFLCNDTGETSLKNEKAILISIKTQNICLKFTLCQKFSCTIKSVCDVKAYTLICYVTVTWAHGIIFFKTASIRRSSILFFFTRSQARKILGIIYKYSWGYVTALSNGSWLPENDTRVCQAGQ